MERSRFLLLTQLGLNPVKDAAALPAGPPLGAVSHTGGCAEPAAQKPLR